MVEIELYSKIGSNTLLVDLIMVGALGSHFWLTIDDYTKIGGPEVV